MSDEATGAGSGFKPGFSFKTRIEDEAGEEFSFETRIEDDVDEELDVDNDVNGS